MRNLLLKLEEGEILYTVAESVTKFYPSLMWKSEHGSDKAGYPAKEISK